MIYCKIKFSDNYVEIFKCSIFKGFQSVSLPLYGIGSTTGNERFRFESNRIGNSRPNQ